MAVKGALPSVGQCKELWYTNMLLLGYQPAECEEQFKVSFTLDMFTYINKKGSEVVLHFLLSTLAPDVAYQRFRDCWPIYDKKQEQDFRKKCVSWLGDIAKENPNTKLPRLCASLLLSPGGDKYYLFLYKLSKHVLLRETLRRAEKTGVFVSSFLTNGIGNIGDKGVAMTALQAHVVRNSGEVVNRLSTQAQLHSMWEGASSSLVREYQSHCKEIAQLKKRLQSIREEHKSRAADINVGMAPRTSAEEKVLSVRSEMVHRQRAGGLDKTRELWACLEEFVERSARPREVVESVLATGSDPSSLDARNMTVHVPDLLMADYEQQVSTGQIQPLYQEGKLNLVSLAKLHNCALRQYRDCVRKNEVPEFSQESIRETLQQQRTLLGTVTQLRTQLEVLHSSLHSSLKRRLTNLQEQKSTSPAPPPVCTFAHGQPPRINIPHLRPPLVGLLPPSPEHHIPHSSHHTHLTRLALGPKERASTPEAVRDISQSVHKAATVHTHQSKTADVSTSSISKLPVLSATAEHKKQPSTGAVHKRSRLRNKQRESSLARTPSTRTVGGLVSTPKLPSSNKRISGGNREQPAVDALADQIAAAVSSEHVSSEREGWSESSPSTPDDQLHSVTHTITALGQGAFVSRNLIPRTPLKQPVSSQQESPPLSPLPEDIPPAAAHNTSPASTEDSSPPATPVQPPVSNVSVLVTPTADLATSLITSVGHHSTPPVPTDQLISLGHSSPEPSDHDIPMATLVSFQTPITHSRAPFPLDTPSGSTVAPVTTPGAWLANMEPPTPCLEDFDPLSDEDEESVELSSESS